jgi:hypothetical protein
VLVVGRAEVPRRDRNGFVAIALDPGWELQRRSFGQQTLNHLYFANPSPLRQLIAQASGRAPEPVGRRPLTAPPLAALPAAPLPSRSPRRPLVGAVPEESPGAAVEPGRTIALTVIPFQE